MKRIAYFDNVKAILIFFVVFGHLLSGFLTESENLDTLYLVIYIFHMPAFILIAGHFSKKIKSWRDVKKIVQTLLLPYILFQILYSLYYKEVFGDAVEIELFEPRYALWFLLSMMLWKLLLSIFGGHKWMLAVAVCLSLVAGYVSDINEWLSLSRTLFFFPFFLTGYYLTRDQILALKKKANVKVAYMLGAIIVIFLYMFGDIHWQEWLFGRVPYESIRYEIVDSNLLSRLLVYVVMAVGTYTFLSIVPTKESWYTSIGGKTLGIYLLHLFIIRALKETTLFEWIETSEQYYVLAGLAFIIVYVLSRPIVWRMTSPLLTFKMHKI